MSNIDAVIFDWAGTTVDFGSIAPTKIFVEAFKKEFDFEISLEDARKPMGLGKWDHIKCILLDDKVARDWQIKFGRPSTYEDIERIYNTFMPLQISAVVKYSDLIPGTEEVISWLRNRDIKIGSCSGYPRTVMDVLSESATIKGYTPDCIVASDDIKAGSRPGPWMALQNAIELGVSNVAHAIKVDDSLPGIYEGRNAGMWTVGLTLSGNESPFTLETFLQASEKEKSATRELSAQRFIENGAHYAIDTIADLPDIVEKIDQRLLDGERP